MNIGWLATTVKNKTAAYIFCLHKQNVGHVGPNPTTKAMRKGRFQPQHLGNHLTDSDDTLKLRNYPERLPPCKIWFWFDNMGGLGQYPVCHCKVSFFVFFGFACIAKTRSIATEGVAWSLCVSLLVTLVSRAKTNELTESRDAIWGWLRWA